VVVVDVAVRGRWNIILDVSTNFEVQTQSVSGEDDGLGMPLIITRRITEMSKTGSKHVCSLHQSVKPLSHVLLLLELDCVSVDSS
jgi:hypothetical protein